MQASPETVLAAHELVAGYGEAPIVKGVSIRADRAEITTIVGPNGAGKSTLLKTLVGFVKPTSGTISVLTRDVTAMAPHQRIRHGVGYVPQVENVFPSLTVRENLEMGGYMVRDPRQRIDAVVSLFPDLGAAIKRPARTLSGGQRNMLALARGLMPEPQVLLVDEPTACLSPRYQGAVWDHLRTIRETGVAIVVVEQNTRRALSSADRAYLLVLGECRREGTGAELLADEELVALYIGQAASG
jgi:ABC-type branched-subunit amino acid transport system ATPase component